LEKQWLSSFPLDCLHTGNHPFIYSFMLFHLSTQGMFVDNFPGTVLNVEDSIV
jgi:hypothetical protein